MQEGNPLKYIDPSGRDFICVKGGPAFQNDGFTAFSTMFQQAAIEAGWNEDVHGPIRVIDNVEENRPDDIDEDINSVADKIRKSHAENPSRPLVVVAFSWGHPGAELLSKELKSGDSPLDIDLYIGIEPEDFSSLVYICGLYRNEHVRCRNGCRNICRRHGVVKNRI